MSFAELEREIERARGELGAHGPRPLMLRAEASLGFISRLLACLRARVPVAIFSQDWTEAEAESRRALLLGSDPLHPETAVILFTSGSTGSPKAVQLSLANIEANTRAVLVSLDFDRALEAGEQTLFLPLSYSFGLLGQLLPALSAGLATRLLSRFADAKELFDSGRARGMWSGVPSHWEALFRLSHSEPNAGSAITHVISAGAPFSVDLRRRLRERFTGAVLYNNYGLTEASPRVLSLSSRHPLFFDETEPGPVGFPVGDFSVRLGEESELEARGTQVMLGYLGDPEATRAKIREGWLGTGDIARISQEGLVWIIGRRDELFNIGGERTSPQEIEAALKRVSGVSDAAILVETDAIYGAKIVAFVVGQARSKAALAQDVAKHLSSTKLPREYFRLDRLPRGSNGKLVRAELKAMKDPARRIS